MNTLHITIVTPEKTLIDTEAQEITIPTTTGEITVLPEHVPLVTQLAGGVLIIKINGREETLAVVGGFVEVTPKEVNILADYAVHGKEINAVKAEEAKQRAEKAMKEAKNDEDFAFAEKEFLRAIQELKVAGRLRKVN